MNKREYSNEKEKFIKTLPKEDIQGLIDRILKKYYNNYLTGNKGNTHKAIDEINNLILFLEDDYPNIRNYINYRLVIINNNILSNTLKREENLLFTPNTVNIDSNPFTDNGDIFDYEYMEKIVEQEYLESINEFIYLLCNIKNFTIPTEFVKKIDGLIYDIKNGTYDNLFD